MIKNEIKTELGHFFKNQSITVWGIAAAEKFSSLSEEFSPQKILRKAKSVLCYGITIPKDIIYANSNNLALYWRYCNMSYRELDIFTNKLIRLLEEKGVSSIPIYGCYPWKIIDREYWGILPLVYLAEQAGLGNITKCGLLANPSYGTRILLGAIVTTLDLPPSKIEKKDPCPVDCFECINFCPAKAIDKTGKVNHDLCIRYSGKNPTLTHLLRDPEVKKNYPFEAIINTVGVDDHGTYSCIKCVEVCPLNKK